MVPSFPILSAYADKNQTHQKSLELNEAGVQAIQHKQWHIAEDAFRESLITDPGNLTAVFNLAGVYLSTKKNDRAISLLEDYTGRMKEDAGLFVRLGDSYFASKRIEDATTAYERAIKLAPDYHGLPSKLASLYGLKKNFPRAESMLEQAAKQSPNDIQTLNNLSNMYLLNSKIDQAVSTAKRGLQIKPSRDLYVTLGTAYEAQRDYPNSLIAFEKALDLGDQRAEVRQKVEQLKQITSHAQG